VNNKPRNHHFVPQFWIKKFASADKHLWGYDWEGDSVNQRSSRAVMQIFNLYTMQPSGLDDTSTETDELGKVDSQGAIVLDRVLGGDRNESAKTQLATFFAAQIMRDPASLSSYAPKAQEFALHLLDAVKADDFIRYSAYLEKLFPGASITEAEYEHIRKLGPQGAEQALDLIIKALDAKGGIPELPFTDLVNEASGRDMIYRGLLAMDWEIKTDAGDGYVLGDAAVLFDKGDFRNGLRIPLSKGAALYLTPSAMPASGISSSSAQPFEVDGLNNESAARARKWLVGEKVRIEALKGQLIGEGLPAV